MLPHHLIEDKLIDLIERTVSGEKTLCLLVMKHVYFFNSDVYKKFKL